MKGIETYQETTVITQNQGKLIVMLYEGAIKFLKLAVKEIEANNPGEKGKLITKAEDIINELNMALDMEAGGEVAKNLRGLYMFMVRHLHQANIKQDAQKVEEVIKLLEELNHGWKAIT